MKFSWKTFCGVTAILCVSFSLGGALLISVWFQSALDREIQFAQEENRLLRFSLQTAVSAQIGRASCRERVVCWV